MVDSITKGFEKRESIWKLIDSSMQKRLNILAVDEGFGVIC